MLASQPANQRICFLAAADVNIVMVIASIGQLMDQPRAGVEGENGRLVVREKRAEVGILDEGIIAVGDTVAAGHLMPFQPAGVRVWCWADTASLAFIICCFAL